MGQWGATGLQAKGRGEKRRLKESGSGIQKGRDERRESQGDPDISRGGVRITESDRSTD